MIAAMERLLQRHAALARQLHDGSTAWLQAEFAPLRNRTDTEPAGGQDAAQLLRAGETAARQTALPAKQSAARPDTHANGRQGRGAESDAARLSASFEREARRYE